MNMKKTIILIFMLLLLVSGCSNESVENNNSNEDEIYVSMIPSQFVSEDELVKTVKALKQNPKQMVETEPGGEIMSKQPIYNEKTEEYELIEDYEGYIDSRKESDESKSFDNIPVYDYNEILHDTQNVGFYLGRDAGSYTGANSRRDFSEAIFTALPTEAIREVPQKGNVYALYDTDIGIRLYLFFSKEKNDYMTLDGFPIIMKKQLRYKDFAEIKVGDKASLVESIDPIISQYVRFFDTGSDEALKGYTERGAGPTSIHLLTDGILKIEYERISLGTCCTN